MTFTAILVSAHLPNRSPINLGVLVFDEYVEGLHSCFRKDLEGLVDPGDLEVLQGLPQMIASLAMDMSATEVVQYLEDSASNAIRLGDRFTIHADNAVEAIERAFGENVV